MCTFAEYCCILPIAYHNLPWPWQDMLWRLHGEKMRRYDVDDVDGSLRLTCPWRWDECIPAIEPKGMETLCIHNDVSVSANLEQSQMRYQNPISFLAYILWDCKYRRCFEDSCSHATQRYTKSHWAYFRTVHVPSDGYDSIRRYVTLMSRDIWSFCGQFWTIWQTQEVSFAKILRTVWKHPHMIWDLAQQKTLASLATKNNKKPLESYLTQLICIYVIFIEHAGDGQTSDRQEQNIPIPRWLDPFSPTCWHVVPSLARAEQQGPGGPFGRERGIWAARAAELWRRSGGWDAGLGTAPTLQCCRNGDFWEKTCRKGLWWYHSQIW